MPRNLKNVQNETTKHFLIGNTNINISIKANFVYEVLRSYPKIMNFVLGTSSQG